MNIEKSVENRNHQRTWEMLLDHLHNHEWEQAHECLGDVDRIVSSGWTPKGSWTKQSTLRWLEKVSQQIHDALYGESSGCD